MSSLVAQLSKCDKLVTELLKMSIFISYNFATGAPGDDVFCWRSKVTAVWRTDCAGFCGKDLMILFHSKYRYPSRTFFQTPHSSELASDGNNGEAAGKASPGGSRNGGSGS